MFKCAICGKEYSDNDMNEMRLLNRQTNELESFHVCSTCLDNKEDMVAYLASKKSMSVDEARHLYDYFVPLLGDIESPLLSKYVEVRLRSLRSKIAEGINEPEKEVKVVKKKASVFKRLKTALIALDGVVSIAIFTILAIISAINPIITAVSIVFGVLLGVAVFTSLYFVIDNYIRMREENYKVLKALDPTITDDDEEDKENNKA